MNRARVLLGVWLLLGACPASGAEAAAVEVWLAREGRAQQAVVIGERAARAVWDVATSFVTC